MMPISLMQVLLRVLKELFGALEKISVLGWIPVCLSK